MPGAIIAVNRTLVIVGAYEAHGAYIVADSHHGNFMQRSIGQSSDGVSLGQHTYKQLAYVDRNRTTSYQRR